MESLPDPGELMEARAERMADEMFCDGKWHCCECGDPIIPGHEQPMSADPAAPPVCLLCLAKMAPLGVPIHPNQNPQPTLVDVTGEERTTMSADNWTRCPACQVKVMAEYAAAKRKLGADYGKVPAEEFIARRDTLKDPPQLEDTLREYYDIGVCTDGEFYANYSCSCSRCKFSHIYKHSEQLAIDEPGEET
jgi:hypothetical protein